MEGTELEKLTLEELQEKVEEIYILPIKETKENIALLNRLNKAISRK